MLPCKSGECSVGWDGNTKEPLQGLPARYSGQPFDIHGPPAAGPTPHRTDRALARSEP